MRLDEVRAMNKRMVLEDRTAFQQTILLLGQIRHEIFMLGGGKEIGEIDKLITHVSERNCTYEEAIKMAMEIRDRKPSCD